MTEARANEFSNSGTFSADYLLSLVVVIYSVLICVSLYIGHILLYLLLVYCGILPTALYICNFLSISVQPSFYLYLAVLPFLFT